MQAGFGKKDKYTVDDLVEIMSLLRSENGCPWDREQTHASIRKNFIEETYEAVEAIDEDNPDKLKEELGDVLLQVVFHAQMEKETLISMTSATASAKSLLCGIRMFSETKRQTPPKRCLTDGKKSKTKLKNRPAEQHWTLCQNSFRRLCAVQNCSTGRKKQAAFLIAWCGL